MPQSYASTRFRRGAILAVVLATFCTSATPQWSFGNDEQVIVQKVADRALTKYIHANEPIDYNYGELFPQVQQLPGTAFAPSINAAQVAVESAQLEQSPDGEIALAPGDYAIPVRLYCTHIYTGTAPGLNYLLAQLNGKRAHVITMLTARVGYDRVPYEPVQVLSWAIQNGLTYAELTPVERALVDRVIPDQRGALGDDFVEQVGAYWNDYARGHRGLPDFDTELLRLGPVGDQVLKYERAKNAMSQHPDDYDAQRNEFILEGQAPAGSRRDPPWSQVRPEVLERLIPPEVGWIGGVGTLQIRVLPASAPTTAVPLTDIIGYPPNTMQPVTFSIVGVPGGVPQQGGSTPLSGAPPGKPISEETPSPLTSTPQFTVTVAVTPTHVVVGQACVISGTVLDPSGRPMSNATVQVVVLAGGVAFPPMTLSTGADGAYQTSFGAPDIPGPVMITTTVVGSSPPATAATTLMIRSSAP